MPRWESRVINKDDIIQCPSCLTDLYKFNKTVLASEPIYCEYLEGIKLVPDPFPMERAACPFCGSSYFSYGMVSLKGVPNG